MGLVSDDTNNSEPPAQGGARRSARFAVFRRKEDEKPLGIVTLSENEDGTWKVDLSGESEESVVSL
jgi:hypothetical protein